MNILDKIDKYLEEKEKFFPVWAAMTKKKKEKEKAKKGFKTDYSQKSWGGVKPDWLPIKDMNNPKKID